VLAQIHNSTNRLELMQSADPKALHRRQTWKSGAEIARALTDYKPSKTKTDDMEVIRKQLHQFEESKIVR